MTEFIAVNGVSLGVTESGFLLDSAAWNDNIAEVLASRSNIQMTPAHWEIIRFIREYYLRYNHLPNARMFVKALQAGLGPDKGNSIYLHRLFPDGPVRYACLIAGLPKPPGCL